jgi:hypothetical protein
LYSNNYKGSAAWVYIQLRCGYTKDQTVLHPPILSYKILLLTADYGGTVAAGRVAVAVDCCTVNCGQWVYACDNCIKVLQATAGDACSSKQPMPMSVAAELGYMWGYKCSPWYDMQLHKLGING